MKLPNNALETDKIPLICVETLHPIGVGVDKRIDRRSPLVAKQYKLAFHPRDGIVSVEQLRSKDGVPETRLFLIPISCNVVSMQPE